MTSFTVKRREPTFEVMPVHGNSQSTLAEFVGEDECVFLSDGGLSIYDAITGRWVDLQPGMFIVKRGEYHNGAPSFEVLTESQLNDRYQRTDLVERLVVTRLTELESEIARIQDWRVRTHGG